MLFCFVTALAVNSSSLLKIKSLPDSPGNTSSPRIATEADLPAASRQSTTTGSQQSTPTGSRTLSRSSSACTVTPQAACANTCRQIVPYQPTRSPTWLIERLLRQTTPASQPPLVGSMAPRPARTPTHRLQYLPSQSRPQPTTIWHHGQSEIVPAWPQPVLETSSGARFSTAAPVARPCRRTVGARSVAACKKAGNKMLKAFTCCGSIDAAQQ